MSLHRNSLYFNDDDDAWSIDGWSNSERHSDESDSDTTPSPPAPKRRRTIPKKTQAVFQLCVFYMYVHARESLNPFQYYI